MKTLGDSLRNARESKNLTQKEVAKKTGIHNKTISNYENDVSSPDPNALKTFADIYETSVDYLLGRANIRKESELQIISNHQLNIADLPEEAIQKVEDYIELLKLRYKTEGTKKQISK